MRANDPTSAGGFASYADLLERYARRTGRDLSGIDYYIAFGCWRLAVISEGVYARYLHGAMGDGATSTSRRSRRPRTRWPNERSRSASSSGQ